MNSLIVIGLLAAVYLLINLALPLVPINALIKTYLFQPLLWGLLILVMRHLQGYRSLAKQSLQSNLLQLALGIGFIQVFLYAVGGLFSGFGKNPSALTPLGIVENLFFVGLMLAGMEISRARLVTALGKKHSVLALSLATVLFTFISIPLGQVTGFKPEIQSINQVISSWAPLLAENLLASLLAMLAGWRVSLAYRALLAGPFPRRAGQPPTGGGDHLHGQPAALAGGDLLYNGPQRFPIGVVTEHVRSPTSPRPGDNAGADDSEFIPVAGSMARPRGVHGRAWARKPRIRSLYTLS